MPSEGDSHQLGESGGAQTIDLTRVTEATTDFEEGGEQILYAKRGGSSLNATDWRQFLTDDPKETPPTIKKVFAGDQLKKSSTEKEDPDGFLQKVADKYNTWIESVIQAGNNPLSAVYRNFTFSGNWQDGEAVDYLVHRLSLIGTDGKVPVTPEDIKFILDRHKLDISRQEIVDYTKTCYQDFNKSAQRSGLPSVNFDPNRMLFLPQKRIQELRNTGPGDSCLAFTLYSSINEILIPVDSDEFKEDPNALYDVVVHELGHQARRQAGISGDSDETFLEEGIIQSHAKAVAQENNHVSARSVGVYQVEVWIAENIARKFGVASLIGIKQQDIKDKMRAMYAHIGVTEPFDLLEDDFYELNELFLQLSEVDNQTTELEELKTKVSRKKEQMIELWGFT